MTTHAMAMVKWEVFHGSGVGGERYSRRYYYASRQKRLVNLVGDGGTLWLVTSRRKPGEPRCYHLAYKLVDCESVPPWQEKAEQFGQYMVSARDWGSSVHFPYNDATGTLLRLRFTSGKPLEDRAKIGLRLLSIPQLTREDITLLEAYQQKILAERNAFLSYSHKDLPATERLEAELERRGVRTFRDATSLRAGEDWKESLQRAARAADVFLVLISPLAAVSEWVRQEVAWAVAELDAGGLVERIIPILLPDGGWQSFPELHPYQYVDHPQDPDAAFFDRLAGEISSAPRRRK